MNIKKSIYYITCLKKTCDVMLKYFIFANSQKKMTILKIYIKRLKAKYFFEKTDKLKVPIMEHYCIEEVDRETTYGKGNFIYYNYSS